MLNNTCEHCDWYWLLVRAGWHLLEGRATDMLAPKPCPSSGARMLLPTPSCYRWWRQVTHTPTQIKSSQIKLHPYAPISQIYPKAALECLESLRLLTMKMMRWLQYKIRWIRVVHLWVSFQMGVFKMGTHWVLLILRPTCLPRWPSQFWMYWSSLFSTTRSVSVSSEFITTTIFYTRQSMERWITLYNTHIYTTLSLPS